MENFGTFHFLGIKSLKAMDVGIIAVAGYIICYYYVHRNVKGPRMWPALGMLPSAIFNLNNAYDWVTGILIQSGGTFTFRGPWLSNLFCVVTGDPANVAYMLKLRFPNFPKGNYFRTLAQDFLGDGIFNADDELWKQQRRIANVEFNSMEFRDHMIHSVGELIHRRLVPVLQDARRTGRAIDLHEVLLRFTFDNVCLVALGVDPGCLRVGLPDVPFAKAFEAATVSTTLRFLTPTAVWKMMKFFDVGSERKLRISLRTVDEFAAEAVEKNRAGVASSTGPSTDLLSAFMRLKTEDGAQLFSDKALRDISVNFVLAGRDTSSVALAWFFWLVIQHPAVEDNILDEIRSILKKRPSAEGDGGSESVEFTVEELKQMHYLQAALSESLRLYPSVPIDHKEVENDDVFPDGTYLKKGTKVLYSIYSMGRMESIWGKDCLEFKPERWLRGGGFAGESAYKYPVFNGGPRLCLGKDFAHIQMKWIAATVMWGFRLKMVDGHVVEPRLALTLYMKNGLLVTLHPRHA